MIDEDIFDDLSTRQVYDITDVWSDGIRRVECTVDIPDDAFDENAPDYADDRLDCAIKTADGDGGLPDWVNICDWSLVWDNGNEVRVARESRI